MKQDARWIVKGRKERVSRNEFFESLGIEHSLAIEGEKKISGQPLSTANC
jgi:hypothetical protein